MISKEKIAKGFFWKFIETSFTKGLMLFVSIVLAQILSPDDFGKVTLIMIFITIIQAFVSYGFGNALVRYNDSRDEDFSSVLVLNLVISLVVYGIIFYAAPFLSSLFDIPEFIIAVRILGIRIPFAAINSVQNAYIQKFLLYKRSFWATLTGTVISGIVGIMMAIQGYGFWAIIIQYLLNVAIDTIFLSIVVRWKFVFRFNKDRIILMFKYGWKLLVSAEFNIVCTQIRNMYLGKKYSTSDLAYYDNGDKIPNFVSGILSDCINSVFFSVLSSANTDRKLVKTITKDMLKFSSFIIFPIMVGIFVVAEPAIKVIFSEKWLSSIPYVRILSANYFLWPIHITNLQVISAMGLSDKYLVLEIIKGSLSLVILFFSSGYGPLGIAVGVLVSGFLCAGINSFPNKKIIEYGILEQLHDLLPNLVVSIVMGIIIFPISLLNLHPIIILLLQIVLGILLYCSFSFTFNKSSVALLKNYIRHKVKNKE